MNHKNIILFGYPRSGTTWICEVLASSGEFVYLHEPDNERINIAGLLAKRGGDRFSYSTNPINIISLFRRTLSGEFLDHSSILSKLAFKSTGFSTNNLEDLVENQSKTKQPSIAARIKALKLIYDLYRFLSLTKNRGPFIVKSVHSGLLLGTLLDHFDFTPIVVYRHPAAVLKSMRLLQSEDITRSVLFNPELKQIIPESLLEKFSVLTTPLEKQAFQVGIHHYYWSTLNSTRPIHVLKHEDFLLHPEQTFKQTMEKLGIAFTENVIEFIAQKNQGGAGYNTTRNTQKLLNSWKGHFSSSELDEIKRGYTLLPNQFYTDFSN